MEESLEVIKVTIETTINTIIQNANLLTFDIISLFLSIIAILISIWAVARNEKLQYKNKFFDGILLEPLKNDIPKLISNIINVENRCINSKECTALEEYIKIFRNQILVFKYIDNKFYKKIDETLIKIDEIIILMNNRDENFDEKHKDLLQTIAKLYKNAEKYICMRK